MFQKAWFLLRQTFTEWSNDRVPRLGAALAYYSIFSLGPLLVIAIGVASLIFEGEQVRQQVMDQIRGLVGDQGAQAIGSMLTNTSETGGSLMATIIGSVVLIFGAVSVVVQLKDAMNTIWNIEPNQEAGIWGTLRNYMLSLAGVLGLGFLLTISLLSSTVLSAFSQTLGSGLSEPVLHLFDFAVNFAILTLLFAMMFKWLPDIEIEWGDVWPGAILTALLFDLGKVLIALYLGKQGLESTYGAASAFILVLVWIYYSSQLVFFGAEFTQVYAKYYGSLRVDETLKGRSEADATMIARTPAAGYAYLGLVAALAMVVGAALARDDR